MATKKLRQLDPGFKGTARLMTAHLNSVETQAPEKFTTPVVDAQAAAVAALREEAIRGPRFGLDSLNSALGQEHVPGPVATCPFNPTHKVPEVSFRHHLAVCPDR